MYKVTTADLGTAFLIYQSVMEILDEDSRQRLDQLRGNRFDKFQPQADAIDAALEKEAPKISENCENFCRMTLDGMFEMLEELFPVVTPEDATE